MLRFLLLALACVACAHGGGPPPEDATGDPEFQAALKRAKPEFPRQSDALAAGLYEPFVPPESLPPAVPGGDGEAARAGEAPDQSSPGEATASTGFVAPSPTELLPPSAAREGGGGGTDPTTEELLGTLPAAPRPRTSSPAPPAPPVSGGAVARDRPAERAMTQFPRGPAAIAARAGPYSIQVGAFGDSDAAARRAEEARAFARGLPVEVRRQDGWLKVFVGSFATREEGESALRQLTARGLGPAWVTRVAQ